MPSNQGFVMTIKATDGTLVPLYPTTIIDQVTDWNVGEVYGPYVFELVASGWGENSTQIFDLQDITENDIPICVKILEGAEEEMKAQQQAYNLIDPVQGVQSLNGQIVFKVTEVPQTDFKVQISWSR